MTRVLIVDDDEMLTTLLAQYLRTDGYTVQTVSDGAHAVGEAIHGCHDIMVLDVMMPSMNGLEVLKKVREQSAVPILMLTARGDDVDRITGLELGADDYVPKPCTPRELSARIRAHVSGIRRKLGMLSDGRSPILSVYRGYQLLKI